jgi:DNA-binding CsgD family transcriptional regulator
MLLDKSILVEEIKSVIKNNSNRADSQNPDQHAEKNCSTNYKVSSELDSIRNSFPNNRNRRSFLKLERRVELLEEQSNDLLYFIHFLFQNFPNLVRNIMNLPVDEKEMELDQGENEFIEKSDEIHLTFKQQHPSLTRREVEVIDLLVKGMCAKEIANSLFISETTVITHKKNLKKKFNVRNTAELIAKAYVR